MHGLQAGCIYIQFCRRDGRGCHVVVPVYFLLDSLLDVRLLADGRGHDENKKQTSDASGHTHLLKQQSMSGIVHPWAEMCDSWAQTGARRPGRLLAVPFSVGWRERLHGASV